jgi:phytanoyl-CoA hydroxylase
VRHPLSRNFAWTDRPTKGLGVLRPEDVTLYNAEGYCVLRGALAPEILAALTGEIDPIEAEITSYTIALDDGGTIAYRADDMTFAIDLAQRAPAVGALCRSALFAGLGRDLIGPDVRLYWSQAVYKKPEKGRNFPWHQDNGYTFTEPEAYLTCWIALTDATTDNGCPWIVPGVHRMGTLAHRMGEGGLEIARSEAFEDTAIAVEAKAGDVVLFSSLTPHRTGANTTDRVRKALILQFAPDGMERIAPDGTRAPQDDPARNPWILKGGIPVSAAD